MKVAVLVTVSIAAVWILFAAVLSNGTPDTNAPRIGVGIGGHATLSSGSSNTGIFRTLDSFERWMNAEIAHDDYGKAELLASGAVAAVSSGTDVLVLDESYKGPIRLSRVRVMEGEHAGLAGWVTESSIHAKR
jgi:hypothetical protein